MQLKRNSNKDNSGGSFLSPVKISLIFGVVGILWIAVSDRMALLLFEGTSIINQVQTFKGWLFVLVTTLLIYVLTTRHQFTLNRMYRHSREIFSQANVGLAEIDAHGWLSVNAEFLNLLRLNESELKDASLIDFIHPDDQEEFRFSVNQYLNGAETSTYDKKVCFIDKDKQIRWFRISLKRIVNRYTGRESVLVAAVDITDQELNQQYTGLQLKINESLEPAGSLEQAVQDMMRAICQNANWNIAEAWISTSVGTLEWYTAYTDSKNDFGSFIENTRSVQFSFGQGLPGATWKAAKPQWIEDIAHDVHFSRSEEAAKLNLKEALSVPLKLNEDIHLVLVFYRTIHNRNDSHLLQFFKRSAMDIAIKLESKREYELRLKSEARLLYALKSANMATWEYNFDDKKFHHSQNFNRLYGLKKGSLFWDFQTMLDQIHPEDRGEVERQYKQSLTYGAGLNVECRLNRNLDTPRWLWIKAEVFPSAYDKDKNGRISGIVMDISHRKQTEQRLTDYRDRLEKAQEIAKLGYWEYHIEEDKLHWTSMVFEIFGMNKKDMQPSLQQFLEMVHPDDRQMLIDKQNQAIDSGENMENVYRLEKPDGTIGYYRERGEVTKWDQHKPLIFSGTVLDITQLKKTQFNLQEQRNLNESILQTADIGIAVFNSNEQVVRSNRYFNKLFEFSPQQELSPNLSDLFGKESHKVKRLIHRPWKYRRDEQPQEIQVKKANSETFIDTLVSVNLLHSPNEKSDNTEKYNFVVTLLDISELKESQRRLARSEAGYRMIFQQNPQPLWIYDIQTLKFVEVNDATVLKYGYTRDDFDKMTIKDIRPSEDIPAFMDMLNRNVDDESHSGEWIHVRKNGERMNVQVQSAKIEYLGRPMRLVMAIDVTEQKRAEEREFNSLLEGGDRERRRIASELHDGLGQYLTAAQLKLSVVRKQIAKLDETKQQQFSSGMELLKQALDESRTIAHNLMPRSIEDYGLQLALESLASTYRKTQKLEFNLVQQYDESKLGKQQLINIYRITQEAVQNAVKHGEATEITLQLLMEHEYLFYTFEDNGSGFDVSNVETESTGLGLHNMQMRAKSMSAELFWDSAPSYGTTISIKIPLLPIMSKNHIEGEKE